MKGVITISSYVINRMSAFSFVGEATSVDINEPVSLWSPITEQD